MQRMTETVAAWIRGLVWTAMVLGCAWASAQSYLVASPGRYSVTYAGAAAAVAQGEAEGAGQNSDVHDDLFAGTEGLAKNATHVTEITMDPDSLNMVGGRDGAKAHNMILNVVRTYEYDKPGMYNMADVDAIRNKLNTGDWHCSVHIRDLKTGEGQDVCSKHRTDGLREEAIIEVEPKDLTLIHRIWRPNGPGSSDLGYFPMLPGLGPTAMLAMTDPDAFADLELGLHGMQMNMGSGFMWLNSPDAFAQLRSLKVHPFDEKQMKHLNEQLKNLKPLDQKQLQQLDKQMQDMKLQPDVPAAPDTPDAASAPPSAPQSSDANPAPQPPQLN